MMGQVESGCKVEENPYGFQAKEIAAPKGNSICFCGIYVDSLLTDTGARNSLAARYTNKEVQLNVRSEKLCLDIEQSFLQKHEDAWIFKPEVPHNLATILQIADFDENEFGGVFDTNFLYSVKVNNAERYMILKIVKGEAAQIPDEILNAVGKWIGSVATAVIPSNNARAPKRNAIGQLAQLITKEFTNPNMKELDKKHKYFADARWGSLKRFQSHSKEDPIHLIDPLGNTVAHLAVFNQFLDVFPSIAKAHPKLLTVQNIFGNTPLHNISLLHLRQHNPKYFDWKAFWELPWDYSIKNKKDQTGVEKLSQLPPKELVAAFKALISNSKAWNEVSKCHNVSQLLSSAVVGYLSHQIKPGQDDHEALKVVQYFVDHGAGDKEAMLNAALRHCRVPAAQYLRDLGAVISFEQLAIAVIPQDRSTVDVVLNKIDLSSVTVEQINSLCLTVSNTSWTDVAHLFAKKGGIFKLKWNNEAKLVMANAIAQMNFPTVLPLKYVCVDTIDSSVKDEELAKKLAALPEEIRALFPDKDLWRWTLFLDDETKRNRYLQLYGAISRAKRWADNKGVEIVIGDVQFSVKSIWSTDGFSDSFFKMNNIGLKIWSGQLSEESAIPEANVYQISVKKDVLDVRKMGPSALARKTEKNLGILNQLIESLVWPTEDKYIFLMICYYAFPMQEGEDFYHRISNISAKQFFFPRMAHAQVKPPKWFVEFVKECYGIEEPFNEDENESDSEASLEEQQQ